MELKKGYIYRETSPDDKRSFYVRVTDKGMALADEFEAKQKEHLKRIEAWLGEERFAELVRLLSETQIILDEMREK